MVSDPGATRPRLEAPFTFAPERLNKGSHFHTRVRLWIETNCKLGNCACQPAVQNTLMNSAGSRRSRCARKACPKKATIRPQVILRSPAGRRPAPVGRNSAKLIEMLGPIRSLRLDSRMPAAQESGRQQPSLQQQAARASKCSESIYFKPNYFKRP